MKFITVISFLIIFITSTYTFSQYSSIKSVDQIKNNSASSLMGLEKVNVYTNFSIINFSGPSNYGWPVSGAGDVNGDGYDDFMESNNGNGKVTIFYGGIVVDTTPDVSIFVSTTEISKAGDVNNDGYDDVIMKYGNISHTVYLFYGGSSMDNNPDLIFEDYHKNSVFGRSLSDAGDVNNDGFSDIIIGDDLNYYSYIYFGGVNMDTTADVTLSEPSGNVGGEVSGAGDLNGDGYSDIVCGDQITGKAWIYYGGSTMNNVADVILSEGSAQTFGRTIENAGDLNRDGFSDIMVSAPNYQAHTGRVYVFFGGSLMNTVPDVIIYGRHPDDDFGNTLSCAGDVNGDDYPDIIIGGRYANFANIYKGGPGMDAEADYEFTGTGSFGQSVSGVGDVNGDGTSDFLIGAPYEGMPVTGHMYLYLTLNVRLMTKILLQGFYNPALNKQLTDSVKVYLRNSTAPYNIVDYSRGYLDENGSDTLEFDNIQGGNYYIVVKHRNSVETWSKTGGESFSPGNIYSYDFSTASSQAYGNNLSLIDSSPQRYGLYCGDPTQDGTVNLVDVVTIQVDASGFQTGYRSTDINGDNVVSLTDILLANNNAAAFVAKIVP